MPETPGDRRLELILSRLLQAGVLVSAAVVLAGGLAYLVQHGGASPAFGVFRGEPPELSHAGGIARGALALDPRAVIQLGLLLLIATPVARVLFSLVGFALQRDRLYTAATLIVLAILVYGLAGGPV